MTFTYLCVDELCSDLEATAGLTWRKASAYERCILIQ